MEKFSYEENGYNRHEVNKFIDEVIVNTEEVINSCKRQREEIRQLKEELERLRNNPNNNNVTYKYDLETANSIRKSALKDAEDIINTAKSNASVIVNDALIKASELEVKANKIDRNIRIFKKKLEVLMKEQQAIVDEIEVLEIEE